MTQEEKVLNYISDKIKRTDFEGHVFLAGGAVRDEVMGLAPKDIDLLIDFDNGGIEFANWITKKAGCFVEGSNPVVFKKFGTAKFELRGTEFDGIDIECVMTRSETYEPGSRKPEVKFASLKEDVLRRDLTINSLLKNVSTGEILDLTGFGMDDISEKYIRTPLDPNITFKDDPLRMLRVIRFASKYGFSIDGYTVKGIRDNCKLITSISFERISEEINKMLLTDDPTRAFQLLKTLGLLYLIIPELNALYGLEQNKYHDFDAWEHTFKTVENTEPKLLNRWAALLHDIGKFDTKSTNETGVHFYDHHIVGASMTEEILRRLKFSNEFIEDVRLIVRNHMRFKDVNEDGTGMNDKAFRKTKAAVGSLLEPLLDIMDADNKAHGNDYDNLNIITAVRKRLDNLKEIPAKPKLPVNGIDIMIAFGIESGPRVGELLKRVEEMWFENPRITKEDVIKILNENRNN